jgi:mannitol/fructose-specific phosphotransferase system IIA component (Ntr-type)
VRLTDFIFENTIDLDLKATTKLESLQELVGLMVAKGRLPAGEEEAVIAALMAREKLGSTGIGRGLAVPHANHSGIKKIVGAIGVSKKGIDFQSLDGKPVTFMMMLVYPPDSKDRIEALRLVSLLLKQQDLCRFLRQAKDTKAAFEVVQEAEPRLGIVE